MVTRLGQIFRQVPANRLGVLERGQGVDESEQLDPDQRVVERASYELVFPPCAMPGQGTTSDPVEKLATYLFGACLESCPVGHIFLAGNPIAAIQSPEVGAARARLARTLARLRSRCSRHRLVFLSAAPRNRPLFLL